jgi:hypothetical protein
LPPSTEEIPHGALVSFPVKETVAQENFQQLRVQRTPEAAAAKKACVAQLDSLDRLMALAAMDGTRIERALAERVADVKGALGVARPARGNSYAS